MMYINKFLLAAALIAGQVSAAQLYRGRESRCFSSCVRCDQSRSQRVVVVCHPILTTPLLSLRPRYSQVFLSEAQDCTIFASRNQRGRRVTLNAGQRLLDLDDQDFDNDAQSYRLNPGDRATLCNGENLSRSCVTVSGEGNLPSSVNKKVSSIACF